MYGMPEMASMLPAMAGHRGCPTALTSTPCPEWPPQGIFLVLGHEDYTESANW